MPSPAVRMMKPRSLRPDALDDLAQPAPLAVRVDAARHADALRPGRQHEVAAGDRDVGGDARALGADRLLGDLDQDLLALLDQGADVGRRRAAPVAAAPAPAAAAVLAVDAPRCPRRSRRRRGRPPSRGRCRRRPPACPAAPGSRAPSRRSRRRSGWWRARCGGRRAGSSRGSPPGSRPGLALIRISFCMASRTGRATGPHPPALASPRHLDREVEMRAAHGARGDQADPERRERAPGLDGNSH